MEKQVWFKTEFTGVRYRKHPSRKHGVQADKYYALAYKLDGKTISEGIGWASQGVKPSECYEIFLELRRNRKNGAGARTLAEKRAEADAQRQAEAEAQQQARIDQVTVREFFNGDYLKAQTDKKPRSIRAEVDLFRLWIAPVIGSKALKDVSPFDVEKIKTNMTKAKRSGRTIQYGMAVIRQIFNLARFMGLYHRESPTLRVKKPRFDNKRVRHLTEAEAEALLAALKKRSATVYQQAVLSLYAGLRFGEIASLTWGDVDLNRGIMTLRDTKSGKTRPAFISDLIRSEVFNALEPAKPDVLVFPARKRGKRGEACKAVQVSHVFLKTVRDLGFNDDITDPRMRVCFHTLRHTFASWLVERGTDLFQVSKLLGHSTIALTERYSHLRPDTLQAAVRVLDRSPANGLIDLAAQSG